MRQTDRQTKNQRYIKAGGQGGLRGKKQIKGKQRETISRENYDLEILGYKNGRENVY